MQLLCASMCVLLFKKISHHPYCLYVVPLFGLEVDFRLRVRGALNLISNVLEKQIRNVCTCVCPCVITFACAERFGLSQRQKVHD